MWVIDWKSDRFFIHQDRARLVALVVDGRGGWGLEPDVEKALRRHLVSHPSWRDWETGEQARRELERWAMRAARDVRALEQDHPERLYFEGTSLLAIGMIAHGSHVEWFGAGSYKARVLREQRVVYEFGSPLPEQVEQFFAQRDALPHPQAHILDTVAMEGGFASVDRPEESLIDYGSYHAQPGDTLVIGKRTFFNGYHIVDDMLSVYQDRAIKWRDTETIGSRYNETPDVLIAHFG